VAQLDDYLHTVENAKITTGDQLSNWIGEVKQATEIETGNSLDSATNTNVQALRREARSRGELEAGDKDYVQGLFQELYNGTASSGAPKTSEAVQSIALLWEPPKPFYEGDWFIPAAIGGGAALFLGVVLTAVNKKD
jgi:hypothetical protein